MKIHKLIITTFLLVFNIHYINAQKLKLHNLSLGYRSFEVKNYGTNPFTAINYLEDPYAYSSFINNITYNTLYGNPGITNLKTFYFSTEWKLDAPESRFWKKHTIQAGLLLTNRIKTGAGSLENKFDTYSPDRVINTHKYTLNKQEQFLGLQLGLNRRFKLGKQLQFVTGFHAQGSYSIIHKYTQSLDTLTYNTVSGIRETKSTLLSDLKGKNVFQWQAMIPIGLELEVEKTGISVKLELLFGIVGSKFRQSTFAEREAHGFGFSLMYKPKPNSK
jgi:hypothetical protein